MKPPLRIEQEMQNALEHALKHPTVEWHHIGTMLPMRNPIDRLEKQGQIAVDRVANKYKVLK